jgi:SAM-dependent methyltransferase
MRWQSCDRGRAERSSDDLISFYGAEYDESSRLSAAYNELERIRTRELLQRHLPAPGASVLDVGGGTGVHAAWLADLGYDVELIDVVPEHVERARELSGQLRRGFGVRVGDARALDAPDAGFDAALLLGPLYHLPASADRAAALAEAVRVTKPGGVVFAAAISRYAWPLYALRDGVELDDDRVAAISATIESGCGDPVGDLPQAYSHRPTELVEEARVAGLTDVQLFGVEGPGWTLLRPDSADDQTRLVENAQTRLIENAVTAARLLDGEPDMAGASAHLLVVGRRAG